MLWGDTMDNKELGNRIKKARLHQNLTQEQLAEMLDISVSYVSLIERGSRNATVETLLAIADVWQELTKNRTVEEKDMILQTVKTIITFLDHQKK